MKVIGETENEKEIKIKISPDAMEDELWLLVRIFLVVCRGSMHSPPKCYVSDPSFLHFSTASVSPTC